MKKYIGLFFLIATLGFCQLVQAQSLSQPLTYKRSAVFSPALFDSRLWNVKSGTVGNVSKNVQRSQYRRTMILRYEPGITKLTEEQKNMLLPIVDRIKKGATQKVQLVAASHNEGDSSQRMQNIARFLYAHNDSNYSFILRPKIVPINTIIDSNNNTVKIIESN